MNCPSCGRENPAEASFCMACATSLAIPTEDSLALSDEFTASSGFVGRQRELAELRVALDDALSGQGRLVMLVGEPGIGKTRTAQELASHAETRGVQVLWGRCYEEEGTPPYWPWLQSLRSYLQQQAPEQLQAEMGPGAAEIAEIVPEVREKLPNLESPPALDPEQVRFRLFASVSTFLKNAAQSQSLLLVLDDLHWADQSSLLLLEFLAREIQSSPLLVLGTYRDVEVSRRHPLSETLGSLIREQRFLRVQLPGLAQQEVEQLIQRASAVSPPPGLSVTIHQRTEGNPLFVTEIVRMLPVAGLGDGQDHIISIPEGVRDAIGRRLNRLSEGCNQILTTASVAGREFDFKLLSALRDDLSETLLLGLVDEALEAHVIEELPEGRERYQFSHALIQETLSEELSTSRKVRLHARIGEALEELYGVETDDHASELAHHFVQAEAVTGTEKLVRYSLLAGERALASHAHEDALAHFERGLVARGISLTGTEAATDEEAAALLFGMARAQTAIVAGDQLVEPFAALLRAFEYYVKSGDVPLAVAAAEFPINSPAYRIPGVAEMMTRALTLVPADSHEAGRLLSRYGGVLGGGESDYEGAQQVLRRAIAIARRDGDVHLEVQTLTYAALVCGQHLRWQESADNGLRAIELATFGENPFADLISRYWTAVSALAMGDLEAARPHVLVMRDLAERRSTTRLLASNHLMVVTTMSCLEGDWKAGREYSDRGLEMSPLHPLHLGTRVLLEIETGKTAEGEVYLERLLQRMHQAEPDQRVYLRASMTIAAMARITGVPDRLAIAEAAAQTVLSEQFVIPYHAIQAKAGLALLATQKGDQSAAAEHYTYFLGQRGTMIWTLSSVDHLLGLLSQTMGNLDQAAAHFEDALAFCRKAGYRPELAWTCHDYADMLLAGSGLKSAPTDTNHRKATSLLAEALSISQELGMPPLMERVIALKDLAESPPTKAPAYPDGLTKREVEVLSLLSSGKTDREIAEALFVSVRTVGGHVSNILNKTNSANRTEAAAYATRQGLA
ncbi:MAG: AAA family ATPase [Dehalococcoidia bacterium]